MLGSRQLSVHIALLTSIFIIVIFIIHRRLTLLYTVKYETLIRIVVNRIGSYFLRLANLILAEGCFFSNTIRT